MQTHYIYYVDTKTVELVIHCKSIDDAIEYYNAYYNDDCYDMTSNPQAIGVTEGINYASTFRAICL